MSEAIALAEPTAAAAQGVANMRGTDGAAHVREQQNVTGLRNPLSEANSYIPVRQECNITRCDIGTTETLISAAPCHVFAVIGNDGNAGITDLIDAVATASGAVPSVHCNVAVGGTVNLYGARFENGLCIGGSDLLHDVTVMWRPI